MKSHLLILTVVSILFPSCNDQEGRIRKIDFKTEYKFNSEIENELNESSEPWKYQVSASDYATKGDYTNALKQWDLAMGARERNFPQSQIDSINDKYRKVNAIDFIVEQSKQTQVVIINEAHHNSHHRVFTKSLLRKLFDQGYSNLGLEALSYKDNLDSLNHIRKYPIQKTGYYIKDPQFGNLLREAIEIGYTIFPYETINSEADGKPREIDQARNIQEVIDSKPNEKFLIHCGFDHVLEGTHISWEKAMAARLAEYTGIDPLTINQVAYSEKGVPKYNDPLLKALAVKESSVILDQNNKPYKYERGEAYTDIAVFHPNTDYINNRPSWLFENENQNVTIALKDLEMKFPVMVLAFKNGEDINNAIPIDITEIESKTDTCTLGLKKGDYSIVVTNGKESIQIQKQVN